MKTEQEIIMSWMLSPEFQKQIDDIVFQIRLLEYYSKIYKIEKLYESLIEMPC